MDSDSELDLMLFAPSFAENLSWWNPDQASWLRHLPVLDEVDSKEVFSKRAVVMRSVAVGDRWNLQEHNARWLEKVAQSINELSEAKMTRGWELLLLPQTHALEANQRLSGVEERS